MIKEYIELSKEFNDFLEKNNIKIMKTTDNKVEFRIFIQELINSGLINKSNQIYYSSK